MISVLTLGKGRRIMALHEVKTGAEWVFGGFRCFSGFAPVLARGKLGDVGVALALRLALNGVQTPPPI